MMSHYKMIAKKMEHKSEDPIEVESGKQVYDSTPDGIPHDIVEEKPASKSVSKHPREENEEEEPEEEKKPANRKKVAREGDEDEFVFEIGNNRRVSVRKFRGKTLIDIREFYEADGKLNPGRKGISLNPAQWEALLGKADQINAAIKKI